jgi:hypothetical protein
MNIAPIAGAFAALSVRLVGRRYVARFSTAANALHALLVGAWDGLCPHLLVASHRR